MDGYELSANFLKVPLTPKFFLCRQKSPFCSDHIGEKIIVVRFFLDFLWIFKIRKIRATVVHGRVTRRVGRVGLWRQPGKPFRLERWWESEQTVYFKSRAILGLERSSYTQENVVPHHQPTFNIHVTLQQIVSQICNMEKALPCIAEQNQKIQFSECLLWNQARLKRGC